MWRFFGIAWVLAGAIVIALELSIGWLLPLLFGDEFSDAVPLTRILLVGALLYSVRRVLIDGARGAGRPGLGSAVELVSFVTLLAGIAVLAPIFGAEGIATAVAIAAGVGLLVLCGGLLTEWTAPSATARRGLRRALPRAR
jgi:O-antigen/teichoic acid export membrane protein